MKKPKLLIFDLDGTLVDAFDDIALAANAALKDMGRAQRDPAEVRSRVGGGGRLLMARLLGEDAREEEIDRAFAGWKAHYERRPCVYARPYPGVPETLPALQAEGIALAVLSNKLESLSRVIVKKTGLAPYIAEVRGEREGIPKKPDPAGLFALMKLWGADQESCWMVGDGDADGEGAKKAGIPFIGVSWGVFSREALQDLGAEAVLDSMAEILEQLKKVSA